MKYKWESPHDWLLDKANSWGEDALHAAFVALVPSIDGEDIQALFQNEMAEDGYFKAEGGITW